MKRKTPVKLACESCGWKTQRVVGECTCYEECLNRCYYGSCKKCKGKMLRLEQLLPSGANGV